MTASTVDHTWTENATGSHLEAHTGDFAVDAVRQGPVDRVRVRGELDMATALLLGGVLDGVYGHRPDQVEIDLSGVTFVDTQGLTMLVAAHRGLAGRGGRLVLRDPSPVAARVLALTRFDRYFDVEAGVRNE